MAKMGQYRHSILFEPVGHKQRHTARRQHLNQLMHDALGHGQCVGADIDDHQQFARGVYHRPHLVRGAFQAPDGLVVADLTSFEVTQHGV
jgi:hypothetical protein